MSRFYSSNLLELGGEAWVKTSGGWRPAYLCSSIELLESTNKLEKKETGNWEKDRRFTTRNRNVAVNYSLGQPYIRLQREQKNNACLSEALTKLNMVECVQDVRMFAYVLRVVELLTCYWFAKLSGSAQNQLVWVAKSALKYVVNTGNYIHRVNCILTHQQQALVGMVKHKKGPRFKKALDELDEALVTLNDIEPFERKEDYKPSLTDLPDEVLERIVYMLSSQQDLENFGKTCTRLQRITSDPMIWKSLTYCNFERTAINRLLPANESTDWQSTYSKLNKYGTERVTYGCMLQQCCHCRSVFWEALGHECLAEDGEEPEYQIIMPQTFIEMFDMHMDLNSPNNRRQKQTYSYGL